MRICLSQANRSSNKIAWRTHVTLKVLMFAAHNEEFASRGKKYQASLIFSSQPREANFSPKICRTREETAELPATRGILLSSFLHVCGGLYHRFTCSCDILLADIKSERLPLPTANLPLFNCLLPYMSEYTQKDGIVEHFHFQTQLQLPNKLPE